MKVLRIFNIRAKRKRPARAKALWLNALTLAGRFDVIYIIYNVYTRCVAYSYIHSALLTALAPLAAGACAGDAARQ